MQDVYVDSGSQQSLCVGPVPLYQQELIHYLAYASATLASYTNTNTLLRHIIVIAQNIPGFSQCQYIARLSALHALSSKSRGYPGKLVAVWIVYRSDCGSAGENAPA